jgi:serine/threonine-protein kinase
MAKLATEDHNIVLTVLNGDEKGRILITDRSPQILGRGEDADIQLSAGDEKMRRRHVVLKRSSGSWELSEIPPCKNTPKINGVPQTRYALANDDLVQLGSTLLKVSLGTEAFRAFRCAHCGEDMSKIANTDGRAMELIGAAVYVCQEHLEKSADLDGRSIGGRRQGSSQDVEYELCSILGEGGAGVVYRVYDRATARVLALKLLRDLKSVEQIRRFHLEMQELKELRHTNVIRFVDDGVDENRAPFLVTEYAPDGSLAGLASPWAFHLPIHLAFDIFLDVLDGLKFVHGRSDIHRDIKPQNILMRMAGDSPNSLKYTPKIADFGLIKKLHGVRITRPNDASGTIGFMAPEQVVNFSGLDKRADVYSLGATLYFVLTGNYPIDLPGDDQQAEQLRCVLHSERIPIRRRVPKIPARLAAVVDQACQREVSRRFRDAEEFQQALRDAKQQPN